MCRRIYKRERFVKRFCSNWRQETTWIEVIVNSFFMQAWHLAGLTWGKSFSTRKRKYIRHEWSPMTFKNSAVEEGDRKHKAVVNREKAKERTRFCSIIREFRYFCIASCNNNEIFVWLSLICLDSLGFL